LAAGDAGGAVRAQLVTAGLKAMLRATGWKSASVLKGPEVEQIMKMAEARGTAGEERGVLGVKIDRWPVIEPVPGTPAAEAGLRDGDVVQRVEARDVAEIKTIAEALKALSGAAGTEISLTVKRGNETLTFKIRRAPLAAASIQASVVDSGVVYIRIPFFEGSGIGAKVKKFIGEHVTDATSEVILDVRDNPGGRAEEVNAVADIFLDEKYLQIFQFRNGKRIAFKSKPGALDVRVIVLTNRNTGSGAEMLALTLHDNHRATVIGQPTAGALFGKDFEKLDDDRMIVFRSEPTILSPTGNDYSETGLPPDIEVGESKGSGEDKILGRAIQLARTRIQKERSPKPAP
jgi:carboxyl-terminal processing protease